MKGQNTLICLILLAGFSAIIAPSWSGTSSLCWAQEKQTSHGLTKRLLKMMYDRSLDDNELKQSPRAEMAVSLGSQKDTLAVMPLIEILGSDDFNDVRSMSALALGMIGDKRAVPALMNALDDKCIGVRDKAAWALVKFGFGEDEKVFSTLENIARGIDKENWSLEGLRPSLPPEPFHDKNIIGGMRSEALRVLADIGTEAAKQVILSLANDPDERIREWVKALIKK